MIALKVDSVAATGTAISTMSAPDTAIKAEGARPVESVGGRRAAVIGTAMPFMGMLGRVT